MTRARTQPTPTTPDPAQRPPVGADGPCLAVGQVWLTPDGSCREIVRLGGQLIVWLSRRQKVVGHIGAFRDWIISAHAVQARKP